MRIIIYGCILVAIIISIVAYFGIRGFQDEDLGKGYYFSGDGPDMTFIGKTNKSENKAVLHPIILGKIQNLNHDKNFIVVYRVLTTKATDFLKLMNTGLNKWATVVWINFGL